MRFGKGSKGQVLVGPTTPAQELAIAISPITMASQHSGVTMCLHTFVSHSFAFHYISPCTQLTLHKALPSHETRSRFAAQTLLHVTEELVLCCAL